MRGSKHLRQASFIATLCMALAAGTFAAQATSINFDNVPDGTVLSTTYRGLGALIDCLKGPSGSCTTARAAAAGTAALSHPNVVTVAVAGHPGPQFNQTDGYVDVHFLSPVSTVTIYAKPVKADSYASGNRPFMQAFNAQNKWLATVNYPAAGSANWGTWQKLTINRPAKDIQYVVFSSYTNQGRGIVYGLFDNLAYAPQPPAQWLAIAAGNAFSIGLKSDGSLWTWGHNNHGQIANGNTTDVNAPYHVGSAAWSAIAAGSEHAAAIKTDGTLWAWGWNGAGEIGDGSTQDRHAPVQVGSFNDWEQIAAGADQTLGVRKDVAQSTNRNSLWTWGGNGMGQVGNGGTTNQLTPYALDLFQVRVASGGDSYSIATLSSPPTSYGWGYNGFGQLGDGSNNNQTKAEYLVSPTSGFNVGNFDKLSAGSGHVVAIRNGALWSWGLNSHGQLGNGGTGNASQPAQVPLPSTVPGWIAVAAGGQHSLGIKADGTLWAWGWNAFGQLGDGSLNDHATPEQIGTDKNWTAVAAGFGHSLALKSDGTLWAWGQNINGQVGNRSYMNQPTPTQIPN